MLYIGSQISDKATKRGSVEICRRTYWDPEREDVEKAQQLQGGREIATRLSED